jgi:hypothetical protein
MRDCSTLHFAAYLGHRALSNPATSFDGVISQDIPSLFSVCPSHPPEGLTIAYGVHQRYNGARHNPWNEIEGGDHYSRFMFAWGMLLAATKGSPCNEDSKSDNLANSSQSSLR